ncbi:MAG: RDD family protein [Alphaproteobacteria bacterium]|nr:RDD family protein [Alphaproteobacteria bacterium]
MQYAGFLRRMVAAIVDAIIVYPVVFAVTFVTGGSVDMDTSQLNPLALLLEIVILWLYFALFECSQKRATLGKMAIGIVVTDLEGDRISFGRATGRTFGKVLSAAIVLVGFAMAAFTARKQALHDMMAGTLVVVR